MRRQLVILTALGVFLAATSVWAAEIEFPLNGGDPYHRTIGPLFYQEHSQNDLYVENVLDPLRWKEWTIQIWVPDLPNIDDITQISVDYDCTAQHTDPCEVFVVSMDPVPGTVTPPWAGYKGFYASTFEAKWADCGTTPVGSGEEHPWGNPQWVSYHFYVDDDITYPDGWGVWIDDYCIPEPATICLLGLGTLGLLKRRTA